MGNYRIIEAKPEHVRHIAEHMREADRKEIWYSSGISPFHALKRGLDMSDQCYTVMVDGKPTLMLGVTCHSLLDREGTIWMLGTDDIHKIQFGRREFQITWRYIMTLARDYTVVSNYVHEDNKTSIKWLEHMGFEIGEPEPIGVFNKPFRYFEMRIH